MKEDSVAGDLSATKGWAALGEGKIIQKRGLLKKKNDSGRSSKVEKTIESRGEVREKFGQESKNTSLGKGETARPGKENFE